MKLYLKKIRLECRVDSDCQVITYGKRLCGGPEGSLVISKLDPNFSSIKILINEFNGIDKSLQKKIRGFGGFCSVHTFTEPICKQNKCT